jgi:hypothetical protein
MRVMVLVKATENSERKGYTNNEMADLQPTKGNGK